MELYDVVNKLVGPTKPVGETYLDGERLENLKALVVLVDRLLDDIDEIARENHDRPEFSRRRAGEFCGKFLSRIGLSSSRHE